MIIRSGAHECKQEIPQIYQHGLYSWAYDYDHGVGWRAEELRIARRVDAKVYCDLADHVPNSLSCRAGNNPDCKQTDRKNKF